MTDFSNEKSGLKFTKAEASGNDFVIFKGKPLVKNFPLFVKKICDRRFGIGADGILLFEKSKKSDFALKIYNADGSHPKMCGNGARCIALWAVKKLKIKNKKLKLETEAGEISAQVKKNNFVKVEMPSPKNLKTNFKINLGTKKILANFVIVGVPHTVIFVKNVDRANVDELGRKIRYHRIFKPAGTNVDFVEVVNSKYIKVRTYERGVEGETLACGTGISSSSFIAKKLGLVKDNIRVLTKSGEILKISIDGDAIFLEGKTRLVFDGEISV